MKLNIKEKMKNLDSDLIDELIGKAEDAMISPIKKSKVQVIAATDSDDDVSDDETEKGDDATKPTVNDDSIDPQTLQKLIAIYKDLQEK